MLIGEVEQEKWDGPALEKLATAGEIVRPATYVDLMAELATAAGYVGNDSGPTHLAGMMGVATVALFGPTDATVWRPLGPRVHCLSGWPMEGIEADAVYQKLAGLLGRG
jgi:ADP-heptose:LPS heptosyltransferase